VVGVEATYSATEGLSPEFCVGSLADVGGTIGLQNFSNSPIKPITGSYGPFQCTVKGTHLDGCAISKSFGLSTPINACMPLTFTPSSPPTPIPDWALDSMYTPLGDNLYTPDVRGMLGGQ
jgi:hypothetical protein